MPPDTVESRAIEERRSFLVESIGILGIHRETRVRQFNDDSAGLENRCVVAHGALIQHQPPPGGIDLPQCGCTVARRQHAQFLPDRLGIGKTAFEIGQHAACHQKAALNRDRQAFGIRGFGIESA